MSVIGESMTIVLDAAQVKVKAKNFIDANVHDGDDRAGTNDSTTFSPDEVHELVDDLLDYLLGNSTGYGQ